jgi:hypothetical protein
LKLNDVTATAGSYGDGKTNFHLAYANAYVGIDIIKCLASCQYRVSDEGEMLRTYQHGQCPSTKVIVFEMVAAPSGIVYLTLLNPV